MVTAVWAAALTFRNAAFVAPRERPERLLWASSQAEDTRDGLQVLSNMLLVERKHKYPSASFGIIKKKYSWKDYDFNSEIQISQQSSQISQKETMLLT